MANIKALNDLIPLAVDSLYCQPRVAIFTPSNNVTRDSSSNNIYYVVLVDLPNISNYPAPTQPPVVQTDGSLLFPYTLADGSPLPDTPPPGISLITYALPVYGCNPQTTEDDDFIYYPSVYFGSTHPRKKGVVKIGKSTSLPTLVYYPVYKCQPFVVQSATFPNQLFIGTLVFLNKWDICTSWQGSGSIAQLLVQQGNPANQYNISFQGLLAGVLQPTVANGFTTVSVVFLPSYLPSGEAPAAFSYISTEMTTL